MYAHKQKKKKKIMEQFQDQPTVRSQPSEPAPLNAA